MSDNFRQEVEKIECLVLEHKILALEAVDRICAAAERMAERLDTKKMIEPAQPSKLTKKVIKWFNDGISECQTELNKELEGK